MVIFLKVWRRGLLAALAAMLVVTASGCGGGPKADENDPWTVVMDYIDAVNASDAGAIEDLVDPVYDASEDISSRIKRLGGQSLHYETIQFHGTGMQGLTTADLTLRGGGSTTTYTDSLPLARSNSHWYLTIGRHR
jgi:hypothetical protein